MLTCDHCHKEIGTTATAVLTWPTRPEDLREPSGPHIAIVHADEEAGDRRRGCHRLHDRLHYTVDGDHVSVDQPGDDGDWCVGFGRLLLEWDRSHSASQGELFSVIARLLMSGHLHKTIARCEFIHEMRTLPEKAHAVFLKGMDEVPSPAADRALRERFLTTIANAGRRSDVSSM